MYDIVHEKKWEIKHGLDGKEEYHARRLAADNYFRNEYAGDSDSESNDWNKSCDVEAEIRDSTNISDQKVLAVEESAVL